MKRLLICWMFFPIATETYAQADGIVHTANVSVEEFKKVMDSLENELIIDLRTPEELKQGKIEGAKVIDFFGADFEPSLTRLDRDKTYLLYCASGGRSTETAALMEKMGFKNIYNLQGGFNGWVRKKMPVKKQ